MGIDLHGLRWLQYVAINEPLGDVAMLGRQCVHIDAASQSKLLGTPHGKTYGPYCEELLLERLGATSVTSFDASDYEGATVVHDMNVPLQDHRQFDTVLDIGTLEHVFNFPVGLANVAALCKKGGRIVHALPANNYNGHGFYQFSPELFFSLYSAQNGFAETEVFIAEVDDERHWWKSAVPVGGVRVEYTSGQRSYVMAVTRKITERTRQTVQQSDYVMNWKDGEVKPRPLRPSLRTFSYSILKKVPLLWRYADALAGPINTHVNAECHRLSKSNPHYHRVRIDTLVCRP